MASLQERLKLIRQSAATSASAPAQAQGPPAQARAQAQAPGEAPQSVKPVGQDEVDALLRQTAEEVSLDKEQAGQAPSSGEEDVDRWLGYGSEGSDDGAVISADTLHGAESESREMTRQAEEALQNLHSEGVMSKAKSSLLQIEAKEAPVLSRTTSNQSSYVSDDGAGQVDSLQNDLADAMAGHLGPPLQQQEQDEGKVHSPPSSSREVEEMMKRLAHLRSNNMPAQNTVEVADSSESTFGFDLPSVPKTAPIAGRKDGEAQDWKERNGVQGRDLSSFEALVRLKATTLGVPGQRPKASSNAGKVDETEEWCCICNEDATLSCLGCDNDLYCRPCWNEGHQDMQRDELVEHPTRLLAKRRKPVSAA